MHFIAYRNGIFFILSGSVVEAVKLVDAQFGPCRHCSYKGHNMCMRKSYYHQIIPSVLQIRNG